MDETYADKPIHEKLSHLKLLDCVIKECTRLHNPVSDFGRKAVTDVDICGYPFPAGTQITVDLASLHNNPEVWEQANEFRPERFFSGEYAKRHSCSFVPFSAGPRNCIGQKFAMLEVKTYMYLILKSCAFESMQKYEELNVSVSVMKNCENGIYVKFRSRLEK